jgi:hypothetical protein
MNRHSNTTAELRRSGEQWKRVSRVESTIAARPPLSGLAAADDTDVRVIEHIEKVVDNNKMDSTIAIDMRRSLLEARRTAAQGSGEK